ncbi:hypothetical protein [Thalassotalea piscium]|uniref:Uncharacterized protein n=1 Tax=Thalassotalea piscium TaxID=1230533 RepID=A0A7X0NFZ4_9GAMM|nr:hypothetical protein [Thalassotalea piscium]MBB6542586.1 hypothetical protein [Thalassotalea piscium]
MLFHYERTRKKQAYTLAINIALLPVYLYILSITAKEHNDFEALFAIAEKSALGIGILLTAAMVWFLRSKDKFEIYVTHQEFYSMHPIFKEWCFSVNPKEIKCIKNHYGSGSKMTRIDLVMHNGDTFQICPNYDFSRKKLYQALQTANPLIELPANANLFTAETK